MNWPILHSDRTRLVLSIASFYTLVLLISWTPGMLMVNLHHSASPANNGLKFALLALFGLGPAIAALVNSRIFRQQSEFPLRPMLKAPRQPGPMIFWAIALPVLFSVATGLVAQVISESNSHQVPPATWREVILALMFSLVANPWEEIAWRGHALRRLAVLYSLRTSTIIVGILTTLWHLPLFWIGFGSMRIENYWQWSMGSLAFSFMASWLFQKSGTNIWITSLFHVALNTLTVASGIHSDSAYAIASAIFLLFFFYQLQSKLTQPQADSQ